MRDIGLSCEKNNYERKAVTSLRCADGEIEIADQLCSAQCPSNMVSCEATCVENKEACSALLSDITLNIT